MGSQWIGLCIQFVYYYNDSWRSHFTGCPPESIGYSQWMYTLNLSHSAVLKFLWWMNVKCWYCINVLVHYHWISSHVAYVITWLRVLWLLLPRVGVPQKSRRAPVKNQSINQSRFFYSDLSNLNHCEVHYSARRKDCCSGNVFKWRLNDCNVEAETTCSGREFQMWAVATGKARLPTVARLTGGTTRWLVPAERSTLRPGTSTVEVSGPRYSIQYAPHFKTIRHSSLKKR